MSSSVKPTAADLKTYAKTKRLAKHAESELRRELGRIIRSVGDPNLVRGELSKPRIKSPTSLARKTAERGWTFADTVSRTEDFVGFRIVCHNLQDVRRIATLIQKSLRKNGLNVSRRDYVTSPKNTGYRAVHLLTRIRITVGSDTADIGCEIQVRSFLQDAWARLSHVDFYAQGIPVPPSLERRMRALSMQLARADDSADDIRSRIARPVHGTQPIRASPLTSSALAFLYRERFSTDPPDYIIQSILREIGGAQLRADGLYAALTDNSLVRALSTAYEGTSRFDAEPYQLFRWIVHSLLYGKDKAVRLAAREGRQDWNEIESIAQREILGDTTADEMLHSLEYAQKDDDPEGELESWANALGATTQCIMCGARIVNADGFARAAVKRSHIRGKHAARLIERLEEAASSSGIEAGSYDNPSMCSHCSFVMAKDD